MEQLLAHLVGDYLLQTAWMASEKSKRWVPALVHGLVYSLPFLMVTQAPWALLFIGGTHAVLDRYRVGQFWSRQIVDPACPDYMKVWLGVVVDNTFHMALNYLALRYL